MASCSTNRAIFLNCLEKELFNTVLKELTGDSTCDQNQSYSWKVDNKYYSTTIILDLYSQGKEKQVDLRSENYEAVVIFLDCSQKNNTWISDLGHYWSSIMQQLSTHLPTVCLVLAAVKEEKQMQELTEWCVEESFELIEWLSDGQVEEDEFSNGRGAKRLSDALQAHIWPEMSMKSRTNKAEVASNELEVASNEPEVASNEPEVAASQLDRVFPENYSSSEEQILAEGLEPDDKDPGGETFEQLFSRFADMKEHADQLSHEERKDYAEKAVLAFWKAIGGDEEEVKDTINHR